MSIMLLCLVDCVVCFAFCIAAAGMVYGWLDSENMFFVAFFFATSIGHVGSVRFGFNKEPKRP